MHFLNSPLPNSPPWPNIHQSTRTPQSCSALENRNCWMVTHAAHDDSGHFGISNLVSNRSVLHFKGKFSVLFVSKKSSWKCWKCFMCIGSEYLFCSLGRADSHRATLELVQPLHSSFFYAVNIVHCLWVPKKWLLNCMITNSWLWITIFARLSSPLLLLLLWVAWICFGPFDSVAYHTIFCIAENSWKFRTLAVAMFCFFWVVKWSLVTRDEAPRHPIPWESHGSEPWHSGRATAARSWSQQNETKPLKKPILWNYNILYWVCNMIYSIMYIISIPYYML